MTVIGYNNHCFTLFTKRSHRSTREHLKTASISGSLKCRYDRWMQLSNAPMKTVYQFFLLKTYFFELVSDGLSDSHQIGSDHLQTMLAKSSSWLVKLFSITRVRIWRRAHQTDERLYICNAFQTKLGVCYKNNGHTTSIWQQCHLWLLTITVFLIDKTL